MLYFARVRARVSLTHRVRHHPMRLSLTFRVRSRPAGLAILFASALLALCFTRPTRACQPEAPAAPELDGAVKWLNSPPLSMKELRGKVVLVDFWEYTCVNCIRTLPYLKAWWERYKDQGLVIVGVHSPEFQFAGVEQNVANAVREFGIRYPVAVDSQHAIWNAYGNRFWPAKYLIDAKGRVRYWHFGEGGYGLTESQLQELLREVNPGVKLPAVMAPIRKEDGPGKLCYPATPELYAGFERGATEGTFGSPNGYQPGRVASYVDPGKHEDGMIYAQGAWKATPEALVSARRARSAKSWIALRYHAIEVNSVLKPEDGRPVTLWVTQDGKPVPAPARGKDVHADDRGRTYVKVDRPRMYALVRNPAFGQHELKLTPADTGLGLYSFTFVSCVVEEH